MGHMSFGNLIKISKKEVVKEMHDILKLVDTLCEHCLQGKQTKTNLKSKE
jgi:hypothetical protein